MDLELLGFLRFGLMDKGDIGKQCAGSR